MNNMVDRDDPSDNFLCVYGLFGITADSADRPPEGT